MASTRVLDSRDTVLPVFEQFREELDDHNDRRERLIKSSRDVTNLSKKVIFLLHRIVTDDAGEFDDKIGRHAAARAKGKFREIQSLFAAMCPELAGERFARYQRNVSPGLQEYIEALSFAHYLEHKSLISYDQVQQSLCDDDGIPYFPLPLEDYLLGLSDLTGELMRFAIASISRRGGRQKASDVCSFVRACKADFERLTPYYRELRKKQHVTAQSLEKIEDAAYAVAVRTSEFDLPPEMLDDLVAQAVSHAADHSGFGDEPRRKRARNAEYGDLDDDL
ncbi:Translin [Lentinus tigrinus ALCF2SS1-7]|uniref:Translin n=1 Tax=Lentinus tigrinus ALCF2SS1-7 TaxID=1328758 RepID=UPI001165D9E1|nr:Translin [Lentinus tigrinus ALCF2SS1-7]